MRATTAQLRSWRILLISDNTLSSGDIVSTIRCEVTCTKPGESLARLLTTGRRWDVAAVMKDIEGAEARTTLATLRNTAALELGPVVGALTEDELSSTLHWLFGATGPTTGLVLNVRERVLAGVNMAPLLRGELELLAFLGGKSRRWFSSYELANYVYKRDDASARQLVWKYSSTLRRKLKTVGVEIFEVCRRRGYRCLCVIYTES